MFGGLSAFPLTPLTDDAIDEEAFIRSIRRLAAAGVDSITAVGSTGSYAYLSENERRRAVELAVEHAEGIPVFVGVGALRTSAVVSNVINAEKAGADAVMLAPMTYQPLTHRDVFELFRTVTELSSLPVIVYDNPSTTHFTFTTDLYGRIAALPGVASIKIPGVPVEPSAAHARVQGIRKVVPDHVTIGVSGDPVAVHGLNAGCDAWYSVIGGTLPGPALRMTRAALAGNPVAALAESDRLAPLWQLFAEFGGSLRVVAAIAESLRLAPENCLPLPIRGLNAAQRARVEQVITRLLLSP
jgi:4-hydroxy-tetrahydrodipicolinate synthase